VAPIGARMTGGGQKGRRGEALAEGVTEKTWEGRRDAHGREVSTGDARRWRAGGVGRVVRARES